VAEDMKTGDVITEQNVRSVRPGYGLHPKYWDNIAGKKVDRNLKKGTRFDIRYMLGLK
jgi:pseudaminic acid synthase